jgi:Trypsin-like peptidase domain
MLQLKTFEEQIFFATALIFSIGSDGKASVGTGFLLRADLTSEKHVILAVTNKHVLVDRYRHFELHFTQADTSTTPPTPLLGTTTRLHGTLPADISYFEHPDPDVDLACLNVSTIGHAEPAIFYRTLSLEMAASFEEDWLVPNREVCFIGYPDGRYDEKNNLPILRRGVIASMPKVDFNGEKQFLIDAQVYQGSSGSPVFICTSPLGGQIRFLGVLNAGMMKHEKLTRVPVSIDRFGIRHTIGLGFVLKPVLVRELVDTAVNEVRAHLDKEAAKNAPQQAA